MTALLKSARRRGGGPILKGPRIFLRPPRRRDRDAWIAIRSASRDFLEPWEPTWTKDALTRSAFRRRLRRQIHDSEGDTGYGFFIFHSSDEALIGGITISRVQRGVVQSCSLGYWIGEAHARQGYMTEGLHRVLPYCFRTLSLRRVEAACLPENTASRRLLEKCGFQMEGEAREYLKIAGHWRDHVLFALLAHEYMPPDAPG